jgi:hypothetical protein
MSGHHIHLELNTGWLHARFSCHEPSGAECRRSCTRGCEEITEHCRVEHEWENVDYCNLVTWLEESGTWDELYDGPKVLARSGQIATKWNGDSYTWSYAPDSLVGLVDAR